MKLRSFLLWLSYITLSFDFKLPCSRHCLILHAAFLAAACHRIVRERRRTIYSICNQASVAVEYVFESIDAEL